jgi:hypothetical protein
MAGAASSPTKESKWNINVDLTRACTVYLQRVSKVVELDPTFEKNIQGITDSGGGEIMNWHDQDQASRSSSERLGLLGE